MLKRCVLFDGLARETRVSGHPWCVGDGWITGASNVDGRTDAGGGDTALFADAVLLLTLRSAWFVINTACDGEQLIKGELGGLGVDEGHGLVRVKCVGVGCVGGE